MAVRLSGSTIKSWFQYRCERKTRYEIMDPSELAAIPVAKNDREQPWANLGVDYEDRVVSRLARETTVLRPGPGDEGLFERHAIAFLKQHGSARYAAQVNLRPSSRPSFLGSDVNIQLRRSFADLIRRDATADGPRFRVIDIKATRSARAFHKTQVAFYALLLRTILSELGNAGSVDTQAEIWRIPDDGNAEGDTWTIEEFALAPYLRLVEDFCSATLPTIASKVVASGRDETFFHVYFKCEQCAYLPHCIEAVGPGRSPRVRDVSAVAGLSHEAKRTLLSIGVRSVEQLAELGAGVGRIDGAGWSLSRRADLLVSRARALREGSVQPGPEQHTFLMPPRADVAVYLVADHDPVDDTLVTLGYRYVDRSGVHEHIEVLPTSDRSAEADALVRVFGLLVSDLEAVDAHNAAVNDVTAPSNLYAHIFLYEATEAVELQNAVKRHLDDPRVRTGLLHMVRLFPPDEVVPEPEFRGMQHLPATALRSVVEQLLSLPVTVSYDLRQVSGALFSAGLIAHEYAPAAPFERPFSSLLALDVSRNLREGRRGGLDQDAIRSDVSARLSATQAIADWLRAEHRRRIETGGPPMLRLNKQPFRFQATFDPLDAADLDVLRAFELLENRAGLLEAMIRLSQSARIRRDTGRAIGPMRLLNVSEKQRFAYLLFSIPPEVEEADIAAGAFGLILSDGEPDLLLEPRLWPSLACNLLDPRPGDGPNFLRVRVFRGVFNGRMFQDLKRRAGQDCWWLDQSFIDFNSPKADAFLSFLGAQATP
ncbi:PD-(D/E)XK nuclease family protein [Rhodomicrobium vannielii ATCC 17100]|uniref:PD-(D/E)XK nuclease family protein n=1 Tax=Rhodomicrobium vannielii TaxID=1069 RepID=UPI001919A579|nr:PD-(D/E)XK nuclease family protein [Rhodomicrobium vannielii]MBJ7533298.1 PD-(D/E)XK nuclease family protein [Rhodomicrobium vannielii ATCC 17100]